MGYPGEVVGEPVGIAVELVRLIEAVANETGSVSLELDGIAVGSSVVAVRSEQPNASSLSLLVLKAQLLLLTCAYEVFL